MIVIIGESAAGKSTLLNNFIKQNPEYKKIVTYTTRPKRKEEKDGIDYKFIPESTFNEFLKRDFFVDYAIYRDWMYGVAKTDCENTENAIIVLTPAGLRNLKKQGIDITSIYLAVDRRSRLINSLLRGDEIEEAYRRNLTDVGRFDNIISEVDYVIENMGFKMNEEQVAECLTEIIKIEKQRREEEKNNNKEG